MFELLDIVRVKKEYPELSLTTNNIGTIVDVHNGGEAYTVEFIDKNGDTIEKALYTEFTESELEYVSTKLDGGSLEGRTVVLKKLVEEYKNVNLEFLDIGLPLEAENFETASEEIAKFREYCKLLGKKPEKLTQKELCNFYKRTPF